MSMNFQIVRYNFISQKVRKPLRIVMIADLHNQVYGLENTDLLTAIDTEQPDIILLPGDMIVCRKSEPVYYSYGNHERGLLECVRETDGIWQEYSQHLKGAHHLHMLVNAHEFLEPWNVCLYGLDLPRAYYKRLIKKPLRGDGVTLRITAMCCLHTIRIIFGHIVHCIQT